MRHIHGRTRPEMPTLNMYFEDMPHPGRKSRPRKGQAMPEHAPQPSQIEAASAAAITGKETAHVAAPNPVTLMRATAGAADAITGDHGASVRMLYRALRNMLGDIEDEFGLEGAQSLPLTDWL